MSVIIPPFLNQGDTVAIVATARKVSEAEMTAAIHILSSWGLKVIISPNLFQSQNQFSSTDEGRAADFLWAWNHPNVKAIFCARGGYGSIRIVDKIDVSIFSKNPKWLVGFSDVTLLLSLLQNQGLASVHGIMPILFSEPQAADSILSLKNVLWGEASQISLPTHSLNRIGEATGMLVGGNLSIINNTIATACDTDFKDKILFIEDIDEYLYHIDRMMQHLKYASKLENLAGLVVGHFTNMRDNTVPFGKSAYEIIQEAVAEYNFPVAFGFPVGHDYPNLALKVGVKATLAVKTNGVVFEQSFKE